MAQNIYDYDETNPLGPPQRDILRYSIQPQEETTYLVEIPEDLPDLSLPPHHQSPRTRHSTIVNTSCLPETPEEEQEPLEAYIRKNLMSFRKSLTPEDQIRSSRRTPSEKGDEGSQLVLPESESSLSRQKTENKLKDSTETKMGELGNDKVAHNEVMASQNDDTVRLETRSVDSCPEYCDHCRFNDDTTVMQVSDHEGVFAAEQENTTKPESPVKVMLIVDSDLDEDGMSDSKSKERKGKKKRGSEGLDDEDSGDGGTTRPKSKERKGKKKRGSEGLDDDDSGEEGTTRPKSKERKENNGKGGGGFYNDGLGAGGTRPKSKERKGKKRKGGEGFGDDGSGEEGSRSRKDYAKNEADRSERKPGTRRLGKGVSGTDITKKEDGPERSKSKTDAKRKRDKKNKGESFDSDEGSISGEDDTKPKVSPGKRENKPRSDKLAPDSRRFGETGPIEVYPATENAGDRANLTIKAPKAATQMYARKRYHIQIPQHGQPETWFNVCFNLDRENNVDMNYEGPVKITNYYSSNKYI